MEEKDKEVVKPRPPATPETLMKGQHGTVETVKVKADNEQGYIVINASDFDDAVHEVWQPVKAAAKAKAKKE